MLRKSAKADGRVFLSCMLPSPVLSDAWNGLSGGLKQNIDANPGLCAVQWKCSQQQPSSHFISGSSRKFGTDERLCRTFLSFTGAQCSEWACHGPLFLYCFLGQRTAVKGRRG